MSALDSTRIEAAPRLGTRLIHRASLLPRDIYKTSREEKEEGRETRTLRDRTHSSPIINRQVFSFSFSLVLSYVAVTLASSRAMARHRRRRRSLQRTMTPRTSKTKYQKLPSERSHFKPTFRLDARCTRARARRSGPRAVDSSRNDNARSSGYIN